MRFVFYCVARLAIFKKEKMKLLKKFIARFRMRNLSINQKFLLVLGAEILDEYQINRTFRRQMDKTKFGNYIKNRIKNWNHE